jgi:hypothetical protein
MVYDERLKEAELIIRELLVVLHDHSGGKKRIADKARAFLGLKPGEKVASGYDLVNLKYPGLGDRYRAIDERRAAEKAAGV